MKKKAVLLLLHISITFSMETDGYDRASLLRSSGAMNHTSRQNGDAEPSDSSHNSEGESTASVLLCDRLNTIEHKLTRLITVLGEGLELNGEPYSFSVALTDLYRTTGPGLKDGNGIISHSDVLIALLENSQTIEAELASTQKKNENIIKILQGLYQRIKFLESQNRQLNSGLNATAIILQRFKTELETVKQQRIHVDVSRVTNQQNRLGTVPLDNPDDFTSVGCSPSSVEPIESKEPEHPVAQKSVAQQSAENLGCLIEKMYSENHISSNGKSKVGKNKTKKRSKKKVRADTPRLAKPNKGTV